MGFDPENLLEEFRAIPRDEGDALIRELVSFIPVLGDIFDVAEAVKAFQEGKPEAGLIYLVQVLPGPPLPLTHLLVYEMEKRGWLKR